MSTQTEIVTGVKTQVFKRSQTEVTLFNVLIPLLPIVSVSICLLPNMSLVPWWVIFLINMALTTQIVALQHELLHEPRAATRSNWLLRTNLHVYTPFTVGFDDYQKLHLLHHQHVNQDNDPDFPMVKGGPLSSFGILAFAPEYWFFYVVRNRLTGDKFWVFYAFRIITLVLYVSILGPWAYFFLYLLPSKVAFALSFFVFSYEAHTDVQGQRSGFYNLIGRFPIISTLTKWTIGPYAYNIAFYHATHHEFPWMSGRKLSSITNRSAQELYGVTLSTRQLAY